MDTPHFDLVDITRAIQKRFKLIVIITIVAAILGGIFYAVKKKKYKAESRFFVTNPIYGDHNYLFRSVETRFIDYFGGDDDLDKITALAATDTVIDRVIRNCQFQQVYNMDINSPKGHAALMYIFKKNFELKRTEYKDMEVSYTAYDPKTAANVANMSVKVLEQIYRGYYTKIKESIVTSIQDKVNNIDSSIGSLTDTLAMMRDKYKIYDLISPSRKNIISGDLKSNGSGDFGMAVEKIQNIESIKDQLVEDRAHDISLINEFEASGNDAMHFLKVTTRAIPPTQPSGPGLLLTIVIATCLGLFFSLMYVLLMAYYRMLNSIER